MLIVTFFLNHWLDIILSVLLFFLVTLKFIPPQYAGLPKEYYDAQQKKTLLNPNQSIIDAVMTAVFFTMLRGLLSTVSLRGFVTIISFGAVILSVILGKEISVPVVILVALGIVALYFEQMIDNADEISFFKIFTYKSKKHN